MKQMAIKMENNVNLKDIERRALLNYHKDGIIDIFLGMGIAMVSSIYFGFFPLISVLPILYTVSKRRYTIPRLGYVKFSFKKKGKTRNSITLALLIVIAVIFAYYSATTGYSWTVPLIENWKITAAVLLLVIFSLFGYVSEIKRMYYYSLVSFLVFFSGIFVLVPSYYLIITLGGIIFVNGLIHLYRFTQEYPLEHGSQNE